LKIANTINMWEVEGLEEKEGMIIRTGNDNPKRDLILFDMITSTVFVAVLHCFRSSVVGAGFNDRWYLCLRYFCI
jgi:hypothetical protein